jgi:hypothetical protein
VRRFEETIIMISYVRALAVGIVALALPCSAMAQNIHPASTTEAAPFLGDWTLDLQGPNGPGQFTVTLKTDKDKVTGEVSSEVAGTQPITSVSMAEKSLVLNYSFLYEGNPVDAVVSLTPAPDGKTAAQIDFAGGAYTMTGTATKKDKEKEK